ncbi:hypothetical protein H4R34_005711, partial [Dimargaris verticillata]
TIAIGIVSALALCSQQATAMPTALSMGSNQAGSTTLVRLSRRMDEGAATHLATRYSEIFATSPSNALEVFRSGYYNFFLQSNVDAGIPFARQMWDSHNLYFTDLIQRITNPSLLTDLVARVGHPALEDDLKARIANPYLTGPIDDRILSDELAKRMNELHVQQADRPDALITTYLKIVQIEAMRSFEKFPVKVFFDILVNAVKGAYNLPVLPTEIRLLYENAAILVWDAQNPDNRITHDSASEYNSDEE